MSLVHKIDYKLRKYIEDYKCKFLTTSYNLTDNVKRIYFFHIRKTAGTSLNHAFLALGGEEGCKVYEKLPQTRTLRIISQGKIFVGWNKGLIESGNYFYAFSHIPQHQLALPDNTFTFTDKFYLKNELSTKTFIKINFIL